MSASKLETQLAIIRDQLTANKPLDAKMIAKFLNTNERADNGLIMALRSLDFNAFIKLIHSAPPNEFLKALKYQDKFLEELIVKHGKVGLEAIFDRVKNENHTNLFQALAYLIAYRLPERAGPLGFQNIIDICPPALLMRACFTPANSLGMERIDVPLIRVIALRGKYELFEQFFTRLFDKLNLIQRSILIEFSGLRISDLPRIPPEGGIDEPRVKWRKNLERQFYECDVVNHPLKFFKTQRNEFYTPDNFCMIISELSKNVESHDYLISILDKVMNYLKDNPKSIRDELTDRLNLIYGYIHYQRYEASLGPAKPNTDLKEGKDAKDRATLDRNYEIALRYFINIKSPEGIDRDTNYQIAMELYGAGFVEKAFSHCLRAALDGHKEAMNFSRLIRRGFAGEQPLPMAAQKFEDKKREGKLAAHNDSSASIVLGKLREAKINIPKGLFESDEKREVETLNIKLDKLKDFVDSLPFHVEKIKIHVSKMDAEAKKRNRSPELSAEFQNFSEQLKNTITLCHKLLLVKRKNDPLDDIKYLLNGLIAQMASSFPKFKKEEVSIIQALRNDVSRYLIDSTAHTIHPFEIMMFDKTYDMRRLNKELDNHFTSLEALSDRLQELKQAPAGNATQIAKEIGYIINLDHHGVLSKVIAEGIAKIEKLKSQFQMNPTEEGNLLELEASVNNLIADITTICRKLDTKQEVPSPAIQYPFIAELNNIKQTIFELKSEVARINGKPIQADALDSVPIALGLATSEDVKGVSLDNLVDLPINNLFDLEENKDDLEGHWESLMYHLEALYLLGETPFNDLKESEGNERLTELSQDFKDLKTNIDKLKLSPQNLTENINLLQDLENAFKTVNTKMKHYAVLGIVSKAVSDEYNSIFSAINNMISAIRKDIHPPTISLRT